MNYEDLRAVSLDGIAPALERIAVALETIAGDIIERRERQQAALVSQYAHLHNEVRRAEERFGSADNRMARMDRYAPDSERARVSAWANAQEQIAIAARADLDAFAAAHPDIATTAVAP